MPGTRSHTVQFSNNSLFTAAPPTYITRSPHYCQSWCSASRSRCVLRATRLPCRSIVSQLQVYVNPALESGSVIDRAPILGTRTERFCCLPLRVYQSRNSLSTRPCRSDIAGTPYSLACRALCVNRGQLVRNVRLSKGPLALYPSPLVCLTLYRSSHSVSTLGVCPSGGCLSD